MECLIQSSMFYSFYLFLSFLLCNVDSVLVSPQIQILIFQSFLCCWYLVKKNKYKRGKRFLYVSSYPFKILKVRFLLGRGGGCLRWAWRNYWITTNGGLSDKGWSSVPPLPPRLLLFPSLICGHTKHPYSKVDISRMYRHRNDVFISNFTRNIKKQKVALSISRHKVILNKHLDACFLRKFKYRRRRQVNKVMK